MVSYYMLKRAIVDCTRDKILPWKVGINSVLLLDSYKTHDPLEANLGCEPILFLS